MDLSVVAFDAIVVFVRAVAAWLRLLAGVVLSFYVQPYVLSWVSWL